MVAIFTGASFGFEKGSASVLGGAGLLGGASQGRGNEGIFVNAATGNLLLRRQDEFLVGKGPDVDITRTYNSLTTLGDDNNDKWRQSTDRRVYGLTGTIGGTGSTIKRVSGDGTEITYTWNAAWAGEMGAYVATDGAGAYDTITWDDEWKWTDGDTQTQESYYNLDASNGLGGYIKSVRDSNNVVMTYAYEAGSNRLSTVTTSSGTWTRYDWVAGTNNIAQIVTSYPEWLGGPLKTLTRTRYTYTADRLTTVTVDLSPADNSIATGTTYAINYGYDGSGRVNSITQSDGSLMTIEYDGSGRVGTLTQTVSTGVTRTTTIGYFTGYSTVTDSSGQITRLDYDGSGNLTKITAPPAHSGAAQQIVQFAYNANGDVTSTTDALGQVTTFGSFTADGLARTTTDRLGNAVTRTFGSIRKMDGAVFAYSDANPHSYSNDAEYITNVLLSETVTGVDATGALASGTTRFVYDTKGNLRFMISPEGRVTEYAWNATGQQAGEWEFAEAAYTASGTPTDASMTSWRSAMPDKSWVKRTEFWVDYRGERTKVIRYTLNGLTGGGSTADGLEETNFVRDTDGRVLSTYVTGRTATTYVYDGMGRLTATTDANGGTTTIAFTDTAGSVTTVTTTASGYVKTETYNKAGDLISVTDSGAYTVGATTSYLYDTLGRVRVTNGAAGHQTYTLYDNAGRLVGEVSANGLLTEYRYDANNRLVGTINFHVSVSAANKAALADPNNTMTVASLRTGPNPSDTSSWTIYDAEGRVLQTIEGDGSTAISAYDAAGRLQKTTYYFNKLATATVVGFVTATPTAVITPAAHASDAVARNFYDKDGLLIGSLDGEGYLVRNLYDGAGMLVARTAFANATLLANRATGSFNTLLSDAGTAALDRTTRYVYDSRKDLRFTIDASNQVTRHDYDIAGLETIRTVYAGTLSATADYTYDNIKALTASLEANSANRQAFSVYDAANRLTYAIDATGTVTGFSYDNRGQVTRTIEYATAFATTSLPTKADMDTWSAANIGNSANRVTRTWYTARGEAAYMVDAEGFVSKNFYDGRGLRTQANTWNTAISVTDSTTIAQVAAAASGTFVSHSWSYDSNYRMWREVDGKGVVTVFYYSGRTNLANYKHEAFETSEQASSLTKYDGAGRAIMFYGANTTSEETLTTNVYDGHGNLTSVTDPLLKVTSYTYDLNDRLKTVTDAAGGITTYEYNAFGEVWKTTDPKGNVTYSWYDKLGRLTTQRDAANYLTTTTYTAFGEVQSVSRWQAATSGTPSMTTEPTGAGAVATTSFTYDEMGRVLTSVDALGQTESYVYDALGNRASVTNRLTGVTTYGYDRRGLVVWEEVQGKAYASTGVLIDSKVRTTFAYDARGNLVTKIVGTNTPTPVRTDYTYDAVNQLIAESGDYVPLTGKGGKETFGIRPTTNYVYDARGNLTAKSDPNGALTLYWYDKLDRKISELDAAGTLTNYTYDKNGNITATKVFGDALTTAPGGTGADLPLDGASAAAQVARMYDLAIGRMPTLFEIDNWVWRMANLTEYTGFVQPEASWNDGGWVSNDPYGAQFNRIQAVFAEWAGASLPFFAGTNAEFVTRVYQAAFRRAPTTSELNVWLDNLTTGGWTRAGVATLFSEHSDHRVATAGLIAQSTRALFTTPPAPVNASNYRQTTFLYDNLNRQTRTSLTDVTVGYWDGTTYVTSTGWLNTVYVYDANGNVTQMTTPRGHITRYWYDTLNRKTAQLDAENYVTTWSYDAEGNVLQEKRFANIYSGTIDANVPNPGSQANDRITTYTYDVNGNRLTETRTGVIAWKVDATTGALNGDGTSAVITYTYNAMGQVLTKSVTGVTTAIMTYEYDIRGRLHSEAHKGYIDADGVWVTPKVFYYYDASDNVVRTLRQGTTGTYGVADRVTKYTYGAGGRLLSTTDEEGFAHNYGYDAAGNVVRDSYSRLANSSTSADSTATGTIAEGIIYRRDALGRVIEQSVAIDGTSWNKLSTQFTEYNAWGQVLRSGTNTNGGAALWQVSNQYDRAGQLTGTNSGDGVWKFFSYDSGGNQTAAIASAGASFTSATGFAGALALVGGADVNATYTSYDKRNMAVAVTEEGRDVSGSLTGQLLITRRYRNAFGEIWKETNAAGASVVYLFNTMGRVIRMESPAVQVTNEDGSTNWIKPTEEFYYDLGGRLIAKRDARGTYGSGGTQSAPMWKTGNTGTLTTYALLAGTGYDGGEALIAVEFHADGGKKETLYDRMGDARVIGDELYSASTPSLHVTEQRFNRLSQLIEVKHNRATESSDDNSRLVDWYVYDQFGQRIQHYNNQYSTSGVYFIDKTAYDGLGRVTSQTDMEGNTTTTAYTWDGALVTSGVGTFGGWVETTSYSGSSRTSTSKTDLYGREVWKSDLGGHVFTSGFDAAGRLSGRTQGSTTQTWTWYNTGQIKQTVGPAGTEDYGYDVVGNRLTELLTSGGVVLKDAVAIYDALGRLVSWSQAAASYTVTYPGGAAESRSTPAASNQYSYDEVGNIRKTVSTHAALWSDGSTASPTTETYWYRYDAMNRLVVDRGIQSGTTVVRGMTGQDVLYDKLGQRAAVLRTINVPGFYDEFVGYYPGSYHEERENYDYNGAGQLTAIRMTYGDSVLEAYYQGPPSGVITAAPAATGATPAISGFTYDLMGRQLSQADGTAYGRSTTYDKVGRVTSETSTTNRPDGNRYHVTNSYSYAASDLGAVSTVTTHNYRDPASSGSTTWRSTNVTTNAYDWWDGASQGTVTAVTTGESAGTNVTTFVNNGLGQLTATWESAGRQRQIAFQLDGSGQIIRRDERDTNMGQGDPHEIWYRFNGCELGFSGNNGSDNTSAPAALNDRVGLTGNWAFRNGLSVGASATDFTQSYEALNTLQQGSAAGGYTVQRAGETLRSVALQLWGDASLWYKLAEANGLQTDTALAEGHRLNVPAGVVRSQYNASTLKPYDANEATGNVSPTSPKPPKRNKCGVFGQILLAVVAIAVTVLALPSGGASISIGQGALAGLAGSAASQTVGVVTGIQSKFDFKGVALAAIGGGLTAGLGSIPGVGDAVSGVGSKFGASAGAAARGIASSAITQGIGVATGLQSKFSWVSIAAAGVGAGVGAAAANALGKAGGFFASDFGNRAAFGTASLLANAATRSAINGSSFGDNLLAGLPDAIGGVVGEMLGAALNTAMGSGNEAVATAIANSATKAAPMAGDGGLAGETLTTGEQAAIIVTARSGVSRFRQQWSGLSPDAQIRVRKALTEGQPYSSGTPVFQVNGTGDIPSGIADPSSTLAGGINEYSFLTKNTFDDLSTWLLKVNLFVDPDNIADAIDRLDWESEGNDTMLAGNITALHATGNPVLAELASGLEDIALDRWRKGAPVRQQADQEVESILRVNPVFSDIYLGRDIIQGRASRFDVGIAATAHALPLVGPLGKGLLSTESRIARAVRLGREGESVAGIIGSKVGVMINGRMRFPDHFTTSLVKEVKNVKYQGWTRQLQDYADLARANGVPFELWVRGASNPRGATILSRPLQNAVRRGDVLLERF